MSGGTGREVLLDELQACSTNFGYFASAYLKIRNKQAEVIGLNLNPTQRDVVADIGAAGRPYYILKSRKRGVSTGILALAVWQGLFTHNFRYLFVAATEDQAKEIFEKAAFMVKSLPPLFKLPGFRATILKDTIEFENGSKLTCVSERQADSVRGGDIHFVHFSEFAFYSKGEEAITALVGACADGAVQVYETTASGTGFAHEAWYADNGWFKRFFPVWDDDDANDLHYENNISRVTSLDSESLKQLRYECEKYREEYKLTKSNYRFFLRKFDEFSRDWRKWHQEFPATPELAFASAKGRVFKTLFEDADDFEGELRFAEPTPGRRYSIGVDGASGSEDGDFSAYCVLDVTDCEAGRLPSIAATGYFRETPDVMADKIETTARDYNATIVVERNGHGDEIMRRLRENWPECILYREQKLSRKGGGPTERLGFPTTGNSRAVLVGHMHDLFGNQSIGVRIEVKCQRLRKEINDFVYDDKGKAIHNVGRHDDLLFACALAKVGSKGQLLDENKGAQQGPITDPIRRILYKKKYGKEAPLPDNAESEPWFNDTKLAEIKGVNELV